MSRVRLGAVGYLNARPLVFRLDRHPRFDLRLDWPSRCAALLHEGAIDLGLIPSIEYLRPPDSARGPHAYRIVPDLAVASRGAVASVAIFTTRPMEDVRTLALDTSSRTSVALTRVLCARVFHIDPALTPIGPDLSEMLASCDAAVLIGDKALFVDAGPMRIDGREVVVEKIDLGEFWFRQTGLPFVFAFWAGRAGAVSPADVEALQQARDAAMLVPETVAAEYFPDQPELQPRATSYLRDNIRYHLGDDERAGLELFYRYAAEAGVVTAAEPLRFF
ncbi:MAG: menaquinone biosynthetic enzyme MqnA/MqnD family protein [Vicinamibacterales bacterium]